SENSLAQAQESKQSALADLTKSYEDAFNTTADAFLNLPNITTGLYSILYGTNAANGDQWIDYYTNIIKNKDESILTYKNDANNDYTAARTNYDEAFANYKSTDRSATNDTIESLLQKTYDTAKTVAQAVKSTNNLIQFYKDRATAYGIRTNSTADSQLTTLSNYTNSINSVLSNLLNIKTTIQNDKDTIINAERTIAEKTESLAKLKTGADPLDIQSQQMTIRQRENALLDAQEQFADYFIKAPFDGIIAKVDVKKGDTISANTTVATLVTKQQVAEISLNEVDAAKIKVGEKATLTFDAIDDLSIAGEVIDLDTIGTVSQGVVTYNVKIGFDSQDDRVKSGMSVSANIITNVKSDVLIVPNSAIKQQGNNYYVEIFDQKPAAPASSSGAVTSDTPPRRQTVTIGLANDTETEIVSGLTEGQEIVTRTITSTATSQTTSQAPSLFGGGNTRGALTGNAIRIGR
ncbi:MAG: efflux RND transporter periplasmic adaptor subunit, partial [Candidatus Komeilibacteria bacterium]|nr:efflux RND transporter periplasmic adaptor subunit [Candidatus Komeilibacteria bacterium]